MVSDNELTLVGTQGVPTGRRRPGLLFAPLRERFRGRGPGVLCFVLARALRWRGGGKARRAGLVGGGGAVGRRGVRLAGEQWALRAAKLTLARAGGGEDKKARSCRDSMTLC